VAGAAGETLAIVGAGTIGRAVGELVANGEVPGLSLLGYVTRAETDGIPSSELTTASVVLEAASHEAVRTHAERVLAAGIDLVCVSVGALADAGLRARLLDAAAANGSQLIVPSGAVGALDALRAAAVAGLHEVTIEQRKPAAVLLSPEEASALDEPLIVFDGTVAEVVGRFPKTTNVAAAVALAGIGFDDTRALVVADPALAANVALLRARGAFGELSFRLENVPSANPRTSAIVAHSIIATLRARTAALVVPG
jgi:aspartate dehydrogenase